MNHSHARELKSTSADTRKLRSRMALRAAMLELLAEKAFDQILITEIAQRAGVGYATFFRHYQTKDDVLAEIAADQIRSLLEMSIPVTLRAGTHESCRALCQYVHERRALWRPLLTGGAAASVRAEFVRQARQWAGDGRHARPGVPVDLGTVCAAGSTIDALAWWLERGEAYSVDEIAGFIDRLIIAPFVKSEA